MATTYRMTHTAWSAVQAPVVYGSDAPAGPQRRFNDPQTNYDDPSLPKPPFVSVLQPTSFTSSMAPQGVAYCPVPLAYTDLQRRTHEQPHRFSTTSLEQRLAQDDTRRMGMSGAESFRFSLRSTNGGVSSQPRVPEFAPPPPAALVKPSHLSAKATRSLPRTAFHYHVNHTGTMVRENTFQRLPAQRLHPRNPRLVVTDNVLPRGLTLDEARARAYAPPGMVHTDFFPYAYEAGRVASTARLHAYDMRPGKAPLAQYEAFPLSHQREFHPHPESTLKLDQTTSRFYEVDPHALQQNGAVNEVGSHSLLRQPLQLR